MTDTLLRADLLAGQVSNMLEGTLDDVGGRGDGAVMMVKHYLLACMDARKEATNGHDAGAMTDIHRLTQELAIACESLRESETKLEAARIEADRMRPVYEAAMAYQWQYDRGEYGDGEDDMRSHGALLEACRACERLDRVDVVDAGVDGRTA